MPRIIPDKDEKLAFRELSVRFLREIKSQHGVEVTEAITQALREHLGQQWAGMVTYDVLAETFPKAPRFVIHNIQDNYRIPAVKEIRALTGCGLYEAKQVMESALYGNNPVITTQEVEDQSTEQMTIRAFTFESNMNTMGNRVSRHYGD